MRHGCRNRSRTIEIRQRYRIPRQEMVAAHELDGGHVGARLNRWNLAATLRNLRTRENKCIMVGLPATDTSCNMIIAGNHGHASITLVYAERPQGSARAQSGFGR
jgi:hypothetical protein